MNKNIIKRSVGIEEKRTSIIKNAFDGDLKLKWNISDINDENNIISNSDDDGYINI